jgi:Tol biopolymer transport system component
VVIGVGKIFQQNPSLSADGARVAFMSTADLATPGLNSDGNGEVYLATVGAGLSNVRQVTKTKKDSLALNVNRLSLGRRLSRDAGFLAFESIAEVPDANTGTNKLSLGVFVDHDRQTTLLTSFMSQLLLTTKVP